MVWCGMVDRFPAISSLLQRIQIKKKREALILGGIIGICITLLIFYKFG